MFTASLNEIVKEAGFETLDKNTAPVMLCPMTDCKAEVGITGSAAGPSVALDSKPLSQSG